MASTNKYRKFTKTDAAKNRDGGYKNVVYWAPVDTFASIKQPTVTTALGNAKEVIVADTFNADEGYISMLCKTHSVTTKTETVGEEGAQALQHTFEFIFLGESAAHLETAEGMINDGAVWLLKDQDCINATTFIRFGDDCLQPTVKAEFTGNTTKEGLKEWKITGTIRGKRVFYTSTVTEKP